MNPTDQPQDTTSDAKAWFESIPGQKAPVVPTEPGQPPSKKRLIIPLVIGAVVLIGGVGAFLLNTPTDKLCLTNADYKALTGITPEDQLSPTTNFYTAQFAFKNSTGDYQEASSAEQINKISDFYKQRAASSSIIFTISSDYTKNDSQKAANERLAQLKAALIEGGVEADAIQTTNPTPIATDGELPDDAAELSAATAYISILSDPTCKQ